LRKAISNELITIDEANKFIYNDFKNDVKKNNESINGGN
jgi:hypothetical protein